MFKPLKLLCVSLHMKYKKSFSSVPLPTHTLYRDYAEALTTKTTKPGRVAFGCLFIYISNVSTIMTNIITQLMEQMMLYACVCV